MRFPKLGSLPGTALLLLLIACSSAFGQQGSGPVARLSGPERVAPGALILLSTDGTISDHPPVVVSEEGQPVELETTLLYVLDDAGEFVPFAATATAPPFPGTYRFVCIAQSSVDGKTAYSATTHAVIVAIGPDPDPDPTPDPDPDPIPDPPAPQGIARALIVYESSANMPRDVLAVLNSTKLRTELGKITEVDEQGLQGWRFWDRDVDTSGAGEKWRAIWAKVKPQLSTLPYVFLVDDKGQIDGFPMPTDEAKLISTLKEREGK